MMTKKKGNCPECYGTVETQATVCCDACAEKRRAELRHKAELALQVGCKSSSEYEERLDNCSLQYVRGITAYMEYNHEYRAVPGLRDDVYWYRYQNGAG